jgi:hypothetical protein
VSSKHAEGNFMMDDRDSLDNMRRKGNRCVMRSFVHSQVLQTESSAGIEMTS